MRGPAARPGARAHLNCLCIGDRLVGPGHRPYLIAEVGNGHDGSLGAAHAYVDAIADAGADAVKFQTHIASAESTLDEPFRVAFSKQDASRYDYWRRIEFTPEQWGGLADHARQRGLAFLSSAFSTEAVNLLRELVPAWKIASGEVYSPGVFSATLATGRPVILSSGMSSIADTNEAVVRVRAAGSAVAVLQCTTAYPTPLEKVGLNVMAEYRSRFGCPVGLSDHSGTIFPSLAALARGADIIELHVTFDRACFGPDVSSSLTLMELGQVVAARDAFWCMDSHPVDKDAIAAELAPLRKMFGRSISPARDLPAGTVLAAHHLTLRKPAGGLAPEIIPELIGRRLRREVSALRLLQLQDLYDA